MEDRSTNDNVSGIGIRIQRKFLTEGEGSRMVCNKKYIIETTIQGFELNYTNKVSDLLRSNGWAETNMCNTLTYEEGWSSE